MNDNQNMPNSNEPETQEKVYMPTEAVEIAEKKAEEVIENVQQQVAEEILPEVKEEVKKAKGSGKVIFLSSLISVVATLLVVAIVTVIALAVAKTTPDNLIADIMGVKEKNLAKVEDKLEELSMPDVAKNFKGVWEADVNGQFTAQMVVTDKKITLYDEYDVYPFEYKAATDGYYKIAVADEEKTGMDISLFGSSYIKPTFIENGKLLLLDISGIKEWTKVEDKAKADKIRKTIEDFVKEEPAEEVPEVTTEPDDMVDITVDTEETGAETDVQDIPEGEAVPEEMTEEVPETDVVEVTAEE